ncbi:DNA polymerase I [Gordonia phage Forza]|uniref:DNA polymerase I n=1 Tax=Gordonia phage Forza TaxID=2571247 RepID=A0A650EZJ9_9CAUD|nr:DNA polymerase I [Gordonia phage Forza]QEM41609.1 DNA polymerase I [Gordonia phage Boopy]QGT55135.1 DNA polymerase I [Gordonia phage Forza]WBF03924.1 DNA polymerase I [Gordonia phage Mareelih]
MWPEAVPLQKTQVGFVQTFEDLQEMFRWLGEKRDVLALDTETSGLDPYLPKSRIRLFQLGDVNTAWVVDSVRWPGVMFEVLEKYQGEMVWHNIAFDAKWIRVLYPELKFPWSRTHDTMIQHKILDNEAPAALKSIARRLWGPAAVAGQDMLNATFENTKTDWDTVPLDAPAYQIYSGVDVILTARLHRHLAEVHSGRFKRPYELEMETRRICNQMEYRGMKIDLEYCSEKSEALEKYVEEAKAFAIKTWGVKIGSTKDLGEYFIREGADLLEMTGTGLPKMDEDSLTHLINQGYELADLALKARKATKIKSAFLDNFLKFSASSGGVVHPQILTMAARTGRMSIKDPALQTLPRDDPTVRPSVIPHDGQVLLSSDLDQVEFRYISHLCGDTGLRELFETADRVGPDVFTQLGREIFDDPSMQKKDPRRQIIKTLIYARNYGAGVPKQALSAGIPVAQMQAISDSFDMRYPDLNNYNSNLIRMMNEMIKSGERPYVETFTGRRLYIDPKKAYTAGNYLVQGSCAEIMKYNLLDLSMSGLDDNLLVPVHDEVILSVDPGDVEEVREVVKECMTTTDFTILLPADCSNGMERWVKQ